MSTRAIPTLSEELNRKSYEELLRLIRLFEEKSVTEAEFRFGINVLWSVTSGLIERDTSDLIAQAKNYIEALTRRGK